MTTEVDGPGDGQVHDGVPKRPRIDYMTEEIIRKLTAQLNNGITTEVQVVYLLVGIRKLIERDD